MYYVYLVDDEPLALSNLEKGFPWHEHEFEVIGASTDPLAAVKQIKLLSPNVVVTDIHMAQLSGLALIQQLKDDGCDATFVVVSAHDRFEYARRLIRMEGFDYLIKPVDALQCEDLLRRLKRRLDKQTGRRERPATTSADLNRILDHLQRNFMHKQSLQAIAQQFSISPNYICRLFSKHLNTTFSSYLSRLRMDFAAELLKNSEKTVKEAAALSGYDDYFYFCRVFRDTYGCTPTQYRSQK
ncbi:helix-turn-helix domain-containing protein [Eubacteriales bacterium OttesenSCG-928-A19]|nr:helix-turn-helix domain-containing protein [Eubacteriales bacterium OttesenSCG-928-A19]